MSENVPLFKEGYVLKKNIMEAPHKKGQDPGLDNPLPVP